VDRASERRRARPLDRRFAFRVRTRPRSHHQPARRVSTLTPHSTPDWAGAVAALHDFFTRWFAGTLPAGAEGLRHLEEALDDGFTIISPRGDELDRAGTLDAIRRAHGSSTDGPHLSIRDVRILHDAPPYALVRYVEVQDWDDGRHTERVSTALLRADPGAPDGVSWHAVHETWLPGSGDPDRRS
jgi:hypothetical protein